MQHNVIIGKVISFGSSIPVTWYENEDEIMSDHSSHSLRCFFSFSKIAVPRSSREPGNSETPEAISPAFASGA
jgi:hypothetical protein